jgi:hypothetical protein
MDTLRIMQKRIEKDADLSYINSKMDIDHKDEDGNTAFGNLKTRGNNGRVHITTRH